MDFETLYREHRDQMYRLALRLLRNSEDAADAVEDSFAKAHRKESAFRGEAAPTSWLYRIVYNTCLDRLRRNPSTPLFPADSMPDLGPESAALLSERDAAVHSALAALEEDDRRILCLTMENDFSSAELAEIMECPRERVRMRLCRARKRLRALLAPLLEGKS